MQNILKTVRRKMSVLNKPADASNVAPPVPTPTPANKPLAQHLVTAKLNTESKPMVVATPTKRVTAPVYAAAPQPAASSNKSSAVQSILLVLIIAVCIMVTVGIHKFTTISLGFGNTSSEVVSFSFDPFVSN